MLQIFSDMKSDIIGKTGSRDFCKELDLRLSKLEKEHLRTQHDANEKMNAKLNKAVSEFSTFMKSLEKLQL